MTEAYQGHNLMHMISKQKIELLRTHPQQFPPLAPKIPIVKIIVSTMNMHLIAHVEKILSEEMREIDELGC